MFEPTWLKSFVAVADSLNFTAAGARLGIRQPTVSEHVRKLEAACGRRLFIRDTHSVALTRDGEAMLGFANSILEVSARAERHFAGEDFRGLIRLGVSEDLVLKGLPQALRRFRAEHPRVEIELTVGLSETMREQLDTGELDLVFLKRRVGETHGELVWREPLVWIAAPDFRLEPDQIVPMIALAPPSLTRSAALTAMETQGRAWHIVCASGSQSGVHAAVLAGLGVAPHARSLAPMGVIEIPPPILPPLGDIDFVILGARASRTGPARALAALIERSSLPINGGRVA